MTSNRLIPIGVFGAAHGLAGEVRIKAYTGDPRAVGAYGALSDAAGARTFKIIALRPLKGDMVVARIEGIEDRDAAERLVGAEIFARRENLPATDGDEFYHADLVGLRAMTPEGDEIGVVVALPNFGAGDIIEIAPSRGGETLLLPFTRAVAPDIDVAERRIIIVLPREIDGDARGGEE